MIELKNITLIQNEKTIFSNFNLVINDKERLVILGESGSGKTTLLRLIAGLTTPNSGKIILDGNVATKEKKLLIPPHQRSTSMLFQDLALWPHLNVANNIAYGLRIQKIPKAQQNKRVKELLRLVGLEGYELRNITTLSGGEAQRIALARALAVNPKIILMDEPLSSLDSKRNKILRKEIVKLQKSLGFTLIYVTHNEEEAEEIATRVLEL